MIVGDPGVQEVLLGAVPQDRVRTILAADGQHTNVAAMAAQFLCRGFGQAVAVQSANTVGSGAALPANEVLSFVRQIKLYPGLNFGFSCPVAAGATITLRAFFLEEPLEPQQW